jgi:large subunit ribosomal protein L32
MAVPKKRTTRSRRNQRRSQAHGKVTKSQLAVCAYSGAKVRPHTICPVSGYYRGKRVVAKLA